MEWVETTGRTVAEALDAALDQLGVDEQDAEIQVLEEPQKGLFGRLRSEARVRARVRPTRPRPKAERRERRRRGDRERGRGRSAGGGGGGAQTATRSKATPESAKSSANGGSAQPTVEGGDAETTSTGGSRKRRRRSGNRSKQQQGATVTNVRDDAETMGEGFDLDGQKAAVEEFLEELVEAFGWSEPTVSVTAVEEDTLEAEIDGDNLGLLVGPKGATLQAVHELVRSMLQRRFVGQSHARVRVDVGGYRARRREALERFTRKVADEVLETGTAKRLEPMSASDRKVVHDAVNEIAGVKTISEGEEPARRVVLQPE